MNKIVFLAASLALSAPIAFADTESRSEWVLREQAKTSQEAINAGSDASFDKRLPPVLPGEEVNDSGKRMKVWSTTGGVPVSGAPEVGGHPHRRVKDIDVIIDGRDKRPERSPRENR